MSITRRGFIKGLAAVAAVLGLPVKVWPDEDETTGPLSGLVSWHQPRWRLNATVQYDIAPTFGHIYDMRIYNRALTQKELAEMLSNPYDLYVDWPSEPDPDAILEVYIQDDTEGAA